MKQQLRSVAAVATSIICLLVGAAACAPPAEPGASAGATAATDAAETEPAGESAGPLADTQWRLVEFQSMDDAIGTLRPEDPSRFTMALQADGTVVMQLDCNHATGTWLAEPGADGDSGTFEFGPLAATSAVCPPPHLDEQITGQAGYIRSFLLRDGRLYLSLMADGGIYAWEPAESASDSGAFEATPDAAIEAALLDALPDYTREGVESFGRESRYVYARRDLDGDGAEEIFVYLLGPQFCGTGGCTLLLLASSSDGYEEFSRFSISRLPITVLAAATAGWKDLVKPESGGGAPPSLVRYAYDGSTYAEQERLAADAALDGVAVLTGEVTYEAGAPLTPRR